MTDKLLPCRKCGELDYDMWNGLGTQADLSCNNCGQSEDIQVSDLFEYEERFSGDFDFNMETLSYPQHAVDRCKAALIDEWNTRAPDTSKDKLVAALIKAANDVLVATDKRIEDSDYDAPWKELTKLQKAMLKAKVALKEAQEDDRA